MSLHRIAEWSKLATAADEIAKATAEVLLRAYGDAATSLASRRLFEAMDDLDLEAATIWKRVLSLISSSLDAPPVQAGAGDADWSASNQEPEQFGS